MDKKYIENQIKEYFSSWKDDDGYGLSLKNLKLDYNYHDNDTKCDIYITKMYKSPSYSEVLSFDTLTFISKLFNTTKINTNNENFGGGCDTCDYGSRHEITLFVKKIGSGI